MALYNAGSFLRIASSARTDELTKESDRRQKIKGVMVQQVQMLQKYESVDGGWGYYDFNLQTKQPSGSSISSERNRVGCLEGCPGSGRKSSETD